MRRAPARCAGLRALCSRPPKRPTNPWTAATATEAAITAGNQHLLRTAYEARRASELPVLVRYFQRQDLADRGELPLAKYLDVILYSREQIDKESAAMATPMATPMAAPPPAPGEGASKGPPPPRDEDGDAAAAPWRIVSVKPQNVAHELPMSPATIMRNALGKEHGGSGVAIDRDAYLTSVAYWGAHATIKP